MFPLNGVIVQAVIYAKCMRVTFAFLCLLVCCQECLIHITFLFDYLLKYLVSSFVQSKHSIFSLSVSELVTCPQTSRLVKCKCNIPQYRYNWVLKLFSHVWEAFPNCRCFHYQFLICAIEVWFKGMETQLVSGQCGGRKMPLILLSLVLIQQHQPVTRRRRCLLPSCCLVSHSSPWPLDEACLVSFSSRCAVGPLRNCSTPPRCTTSIYLHSNKKTKNKNTMAHNVSVTVRFSCNKWIQSRWLPPHEPQITEDQEWRVSCGGCCVTDLVKFWKLSSRMKLVEKEANWSMVTSSSSAVRSKWESKPSVNCVLLTVDL